MLICGNLLQFLYFNIYKYQKIIIYCFFSFLLFTGIYIYRDYGLSWDELTSQNTGVKNLNFALYHDTSLLSYSDRHAAPAVEISMVFVEKILGYSDKDSSQIYYLRHLISFLYFYIGVIFFYLICKDFYRDTFLGLLGCLFLVISPRIFAHAFFNSKDIPFMSLMIIATWSCYQFIKKPSIEKALLHGLCCSLAIDTRIIGIIIPFITVMLFQLFYQQRRCISHFYFLGVYVISTFILMICWWPALWPNPLYNFIAFFKTASHYPWGGSVLYEGQWLSPSQHQLPWNYLFFWIGVTLPFFYHILFVTGFVSNLSTLNFNQTKSIRSLLPLLIFIIPILLAIFLKPCMYDDWRHFYFIYPAFILIALEGYFCLIQIHKNIKIFLIAVLFINFLYIILNMIKLHPYEHFYINEVVGVNKEKFYRKFEIDLWLVEYKSAFEYILKTDERFKINIFSSTQDAWQETAILPKIYQNKFNFVNDPKKADYSIFDFYNAHDQVDLNKFGKKIYSVIIDGVEVLQVYKSSL